MRRKDLRMEHWNSGTSIPFCGTLLPFYPAARSEKNFDFTLCKPCGTRKTLVKDRDLPDRTTFSPSGATLSRFLVWESSQTKNRTTMDEMAEKEEQHVTNDLDGVNHSILYNSSTTAAVARKIYVGTLTFFAAVAVPHPPSDSDPPSVQFLVSHRHFWTSLN